MIWLKLKSLILKPFCPTFFAASIFEVDYGKLKQSGITNLLFDLDNTLVARDESQFSHELKTLFRRLKADGFKIVIVSNNWGKRVMAFGEKAGVPVLSRAAKPMGRAFKRAMLRIGASKDHTAAVGDQVFTDIFGANRLGLVTILVAPVSQIDLIHTKMLRRLERLILRQLAALGYLPNWQGDSR